MDGPVGNVWRAQQEAAARFSEGWRALLESAAGQTTGAGACLLYTSPSPRD